MTRPLSCALLLVLASCGLADSSGPCAPVDIGGECFEPSEEAFIDHALTSAGAWPQLDGVALTAERVIDGTEVTNDIRTWVVPLIADGKMVAISRFIPVAENQVKLGEVALLEEPLPPLPVDLGGEFVMYVDSPHCVDNAELQCLFSELAWAVRLDDGRFRLPDGEIVEDVG
ncbi:MAG TPA: hypothetical protein VFH63_11005 [candidate division Zixibacteria bacterium]|nr:hypothetical protein [candidate division Zixibacteria bacterium]